MIHGFKQRISGNSSKTEDRGQRTEVIDFLAVHLHTKSGLVGLGFTHSSNGGAAAIRSLIETDFIPLLIGENALQQERIGGKVRARFRSAGWSALVPRAYAAIF